MRHFVRDGAARPSALVEDHGQQGPRDGRAPLGEGDEHVRRAGHAAPRHAPAPHAAPSPPARAPDDALQAELHRVVGGGAQVRARRATFQVHLTGQYKMYTMKGVLCSAEI